MKRTKVLGLLSALLASSLLLGYTISISSGSGNASIIEAKRDKIIACLGKNQTGYVQLPAIKDCIDRMLASDSTIGDAVTSNEAFRLAQEVNPLVFTFCHKNMHDLAHKVPSNQVLNALKKTDWNTCEWGFVHGLLENAAVGKMDSYFKPIIKICETWTDYRGRIECAHAVGHGTWNSTYDAQKSIELCRIFKAYDQKQMCSYGLFMQIFWATSGVPSVKFDKNPEKVIETCKALKNESRQLCIESATMTYRLYYNKKVIKIRDFLSLSMDEERRLPDSILERITYYSSSAKKICNIFDEEDKNTCKRVLMETGAEIDGPALTRSDVTQAICKAYTEQYYNCIKMTKRNKNYWAGRKTYSY